MANKFTLAAGLEEKVAAMMVPRINEIAEEVKLEAQRLAPGTKVWITLNDGRVCTHCEPLHMKEIPANLRFTADSYQWDIDNRGVEQYTYLLYPRDESAGGHDLVMVTHCFPGDTLVSARDVRRAFRRRYEGRVVRIETVGGRTLTGTPNHQVLTERGWVELGLLHEGDHLVSAPGAGHGPEVREGVAHGRQPHVGDAPARIDQVAGALAVAGRTQWVRDRPMHFHGDGSHHHVGVVRAEGFLQVGAQSAFGQQRGEFELPNAEMLEVFALDGLRASSGRLPRVPTVAAGQLSRGGELLPLLAGQAGHAQLHRLGARARLDAGLRHASHNHRPRHLQLLGDALHRVPLLDQRRNVVDRDVLPALGHALSFDTVRLVSHEAYAGEVFNLETASNWYVANGIVAHNCRCFTVDDPEGLSRDIKRSAAKVAGKTTRAIVSIEGEYVVEAEQGTIYGEGRHIVLGERFMHKAAVNVARRRRGLSGGGELSPE